MDLGKELWQVLRLYDVSGKLLNGIKSMYLNSLACERLKGDDSKCFLIDSDVRQGCIISPWLFNVYMDAVIKEVKMGMGRIVEVVERLMKSKVVLEKGGVYIRSSF